MKSVLKFILKVAVVACLVVGSIFVVMKITEKNNQNTLVVRTSNSLQIEQRLAESHLNLSSIVEQNNANNFEGLKANQVVIDGAIAVSNILQQYYSHYIVLTCYENGQDANLRQSLVTKINLLDKKIVATKNNLNLVNLCENTNYVEKNSRIINLFNSLCEQNATLLEVCGILKNYVYVVNYQSEVCTSKAEALLEVGKDYAQYVFENEINNNIYVEKSLSMLQDNSSSSFNMVLQKISQKTAETNNLAEMNFVYNFNLIEKQFLNEYFKKVSTAKQTYIENIDNFVDTAQQDGLLQQQYLTYLHNYICNTQY